MYVIHPFDPWKSPLCTCPPKYSLDPYTGCGHMCKYCYITSYIKQAFNPRPKKNLIQRIVKDLKRIDYSRHISMSNSSDPYTPPEAKLRLTRRVLEVLVSRGAKVLIITKSTLVVRDIDLLRRGNVSVSITITSLNNRVSKTLEPNAPSPYERLKALRSLIRNGVPCSVRIDPLIPYINDDYSGIRALVKALADVGVKHVISSTYKARPDSFKRIVKAFVRVREGLKELYFEKGEVVQRYRYLPRSLRYEMLKKVAELVREEGMTFAVCREGFGDLNSGETCDGSHLIPIRRCIQNVG